MHVYTGPCYLPRETEAMGEVEKGRVKSVVGGLEEYDRTLAVCQSIPVSAGKKRKRERVR